MEFVGLGQCCLFSFSLLPSSLNMERRQNENWTLSSKREVNGIGKFPSFQYFPLEYLCFIGNDIFMVNHNELNLCVLRVN